MILVWPGLGGVTCLCSSSKAAPGMSCNAANASQCLKALVGQLAASREFCCRHSVSDALQSLVWTCVCRYSAKASEKQAWA